ncbi:transporter substrate-binding domain-containing protein, partial [Microbispora corallina]|uniref:transporter substrate-binding domain-containing protein n=1 Tax=Microbispora corallina TaxID=83302 RepID=UPI0031CDC3BF
GDEERPDRRGQEEAEAARPPAPGEGGRARSPRRRRWLAVLTTVVALAAGGGALAFSRFGGGAVTPRVTGPSPTAAPSPAPGTDPSTAPSATPSTAFGSVLEKAARTHRLTIGVKGDLPGVGLVSGKGFSGFDVDVAGYIARRLGVPADGITFRRIGIGERVSSLADGVVDMVVATYSYDDNKQDDVTFAGPYYTAHTDVLTVKNAPIRKLEDLAGRRMCAPQGSRSVKLIQDAVTVRAIPAENYAQCMDKLVAGEVEAVPGDDIIVAGFADRVAGLRMAVPGLRLTDQRYAVGLPRGDVRTCEAVRRAIAQMYRDGTIDDLLDKHFSEVDFKPDRDLPPPLACR